MSRKPRKRDAPGGGLVTTPMMYDAHREALMIEHGDELELRLGAGKYLRVAVKGRSIVVTSHSDFVKVKAARGGVRLTVDEE